MSNYRRGARFENRVKAFLEEAGYAVIRSAGSRGIADLWAKSPHTLSVYFIQCKRSGRLPPNTMRDLHRYANAYTATPIIAKKGRDGEIVFVNLNTGRRWTP
ncbi:MAG: restriction endonuclease [Candidatus Bathyarchaeia archaeon]